MSVYHRKYYLKTKCDNEIIKSIYAENIDDAIDQFAIIKNLPNNHLINIYNVTPANKV